MSNVGVCVTSC